MHILDDYEKGKKLVLQNSLKEWLDRCDSLKALDFSPDYFIKPKLNSAIGVGYFPMKFEDLKVENTRLHNILKDKMSYSTKF
jgi:hypothetical protein